MKRSIVHFVFEWYSFHVSKGRDEVPSTTPNKGKMMVHKNGQALKDLLRRIRRKVLQWVRERTELMYGVTRRGNTVCIVFCNRCKTGLAKRKIPLLSDLQIREIESFVRSLCQMLCLTARGFEVKEKKSAMCELALPGTALVR